MRQTWGKKLAVLLAIALAITPLFVTTASAAQLTPRKLTLQQGAGGNGGTLPGGTVNHEFTFTVPTTADIGSVRLQYCTTTEGACTTPTGLTTTGGTVASGTQSGATGFTLDKTTNGAPYFTRTAASVSATTVVVLPINNVVNPTTVGTFFVRIDTYTQANLGGAITDSGVVAASTAQAIVLTGTMPESLIFCTGGTVNANCTATTSGSISFNQLFSPTDTATATSQMAASTNALYGYVITVNGPTLTNGTATIPGYATPTALTSANRGASGWGMNLRANSATVAASFPGTSAELTATSNGTDFKGQAMTDYNTADSFKFVSGDVVANSASTGGALGTVGASLGPTNSQVYTASYAANVAGNQLAGTYVSTLTYICTPTF